MKGNNIGLGEGWERLEQHQHNSVSEVDDRRSVVKIKVLVLVAVRVHTIWTVIGPETLFKPWNATCSFGMLVSFSSGKKIGEALLSTEQQFDGFIIRTQGARPVCFHFAPWVQSVLSMENVKLVTVLVWSASCVHEVNRLG